MKDFTCGEAPFCEFHDKGRTLGKIPEVLEEYRRGGVTRVMRRSSDVPLIVKLPVSLELLVGCDDVDVVGFQSVKRFG